jgi:NAD(P)-dependent dehydrogenase (short-subunit alcohol dehydrogenase family)
MDLELRGKRAVVTGSTAGIGFAIAKRLAAEGAAVVVNGRTEKRVNSAIEQIRSEHPGANLTGVAADVSNAAGCAKLAEAVPTTEILVNNMGIFEPKPFEKIPDEDWMRFFEANVMSGVRLSRHYLGAMRAQNWGRIIFISSESGAQVPVEMIHYGVTKTAQIAVARGIAETVVGTNITANSVLVGPTRSEGVEMFISQLRERSGQDAATFEPQFFQAVRPTSLLKRFESADEVANVVAFLASPLASAITGAAVRADGGVIRAIL